MERAAEELCRCLTVLSQLPVAQETPAKGSYDLFSSEKGGVSPIAQASLEPQAAACWDSRCPLCHVIKGVFGVPSPDKCLECLLYSQFCHEQGIVN